MTIEIKVAILILSIFKSLSLSLVKIHSRYAASIYSPLEMTWWVPGIYEASKPLESLSVEGLVQA